MTNPIIGSQLRKARELLQLSTLDVANDIGISSSVISEWEEETSKPTIKQLETLGRCYGRTIDYFLKETPEIPREIQFRGKPGQSLKNLSKEVKLVLARFEELCRLSLEIESSLKIKFEPNLPVIGHSEKPDLAAKRLRAKFGLKDVPLKNLRELMENAGLRIFKLPVPEDAFSGFSFRHPSYGLCILVNAAEPKPRRNFTLAHELAHLIYGHSPSICFISPEVGKHQRREEYLANKFAAELLMPESGIRMDFSERGLSIRPSDREIRNMALKWNVSMQALAYRLENLGLIAQGFSEKIAESKPGKFRGAKGHKWERQLGKRFVNLSFKAYEYGAITSGKLAQTLGLPLRKTIEEIEKHSVN